MTVLLPRIARTTRMLAIVLAAMGAVAPAHVFAQAPAIDHRVLATSRTSTMEKEMNAAAEAGFRFTSVMGGETAIGGKEVVAVMSRVDGPHSRYQYKLLATNRTSSMQKELQEAGELGFEYVGQTVFESMFGGKEVVCILERNADTRSAANYTYKLLATTKTSTMQKELQEAGAVGFEVVGMTVGKTAMGGSELVTIIRRRVR